MFKRFWSWLKDINQENDGGLVFGLPAGLCVVLGVGLLGVGGGLGVGLSFGLVTGLMVVLAAGLFFGLTVGLVTGLGVVTGSTIVVGLIALVSAVGWLPLSVLAGGVGILALSRALLPHLRKAHER